MFNEKIKQLAKKIDIELSDEQTEKYFKYMNLLLDWNKKINLTAITEENDIIIKHFIDSMTAIKYIDNTKNIIDIGTGAGFPGIPIAINLKDIKITLLDSLNKRINFLNEVSKELNIKNIDIVHGRAEDFGKENREKFDISISRAVANLSTLVEYMLPLVKVGGICICMKGNNIEGELENAKFAIKELGGRIGKIEEFRLPEADITRNIIIIKKEKNTSNIYPRKSGLPSKAPLTKN